MKVENAFSIYIVKDTIKNWYKYKKELLSLVEDIPLVAEGYYSDYFIKEKKYILIDFLRFYLQP